MICFPNCKINLGLYVTGKRPDGYHSIESIFVPVPLNDVLEMVPSQSGEFELTLTGTKEVIPKDDNICWKALNLLRKDFSLEAVHLYLHKIIPSGAGLGGGSSDGAATLKLANDFYKLDLSTDQLKSYAASLGSDCPFFIENTTQFVSGRGEVMEKMDLNLDRITIVIVHPGIHVSTKMAYSLIRPQAASVDLKSLGSTSRHSWRDMLSNDFESPVQSLHPEIGFIKEKMYKLGAYYASMSGSGSAVYGLFEDDIDIKALSEFGFAWKGKL